MDPSRPSITVTDCLVLKRNAGTEDWTADFAVSGYPGLANEQVGSGLCNRMLPQADCFGRFS
jgi:hypothetical protein